MVNDWDYNNPPDENGRKKKKFVNTSGQGANAKVPLNVKDKFNWGAFLLSWIWGLGNKTYITLINIVLFFIPIVNLGVAIWFGIKGNEWAWKNKRFDGINQFHENQKKWATAGAIITVILIPVIYIALVAGITFYSVKTVMDNPEKLKQTEERLENFMEKTVSMYFDTYTVGERENKFYVQEDVWQSMDFSAKKNLLDLAAQTAASKKQKEYNANNPNGHKYFSKLDELNRTRIYSSNNKEKLLGEFYMDNELLHNSETSFTDLMKASMKAYKFYNPDDNVKAQPRAYNENNSQYGYSGDYDYDRGNLKKCNAVLNQAITINYALEGRYITRTSDFMEMFLQRTSPNPVRTSDNSFKTSDGNNYTIIPLRDFCDMSGEPCAKAIINNKYELYIYQNKVMPANGSKEQKIIFENSQTSTSAYVQRPKYGYADLNEQEEKSNLKKCLSGINQAMTLDYALEGKYVTKTSDFVGLFTKRLSVIPEKTTGNSFTTADKNNFTIVPLRDFCDSSGTPCAKAIINNKYELYIYQNKVMPANHSKEYQMVFDKK